ncbi:hypothetical protein DIPPA_05915 [Diplonema papillatum]|nr:hypothetical protein DIPPA_05915 [Diplonema papillatum]
MPPASQRKEAAAAAAGPAAGGDAISALEKSWGASAKSARRPAGDAARSVRVTPEAGEFSDVRVDLIYVIRFTIFNRSQRVQRVRFRPPKGACFKLITLPQSVAPGLQQEIEIEFCTKEPRDCEDSFSVLSDDGTIHIPLRAWFPRPCIVFDGEIDLGEVPVQHNASKPLTLTNTGKSPGNFQFKQEGMAQGLTVAPGGGTVEPGQKREVQVNYFGGEPGLFVSVLPVALGEQPAKNLKVIAKVVESRVELFTGPNGDVPVTSAIDFGTVYFGERKTVEVVLKNSAPFSTSFTVHSPEESSTDPDPDDEAQHSSASAPPPIEASPVDGRIQKSHTASISFCFQPVYREGKTGFATKKKKPDPTSWCQTFGIEIVEIEQKLDLVLSGRAVYADVELAQNTVAFGETPVNTCVDVPVVLTNNAELPVVVKASKVAHFALVSAATRKCSPWRLAARCSLQLIASFHPSQLGKFSRQMSLCVNNGIKTIPLYVSGLSSQLGLRKSLTGGPHCVADDFKRDLHFANTTPPDENASNQQQPPHFAATDPTGAFPMVSAKVKSTEYAWLNDEADEYAMMQVTDYEQRLEHQRLYNNYLTQSRLNREHNHKVLEQVRQEQKERAVLGGAAVDRSLVDIGMVPAEGLRAPEPSVPRKVDALWRGDEQAKADGDAGRGLAAKTQKFDENHIVKKKFRKEPATLNERRECKLVLSPKDIIDVAYGPRVLDFGKVSVFSTNVKSFCVQNNLKTHIRVRIPVSIREELKLSYPSSQVVPPGQTAGFEIAFKSDSEQNFTQAMWFQLNESHKLKFLLLAEAVPIDVSLSQEKMDFRFTDFVLEQTLTQNLTLTNTGNSTASFKWLEADANGNPVKDPGSRAQSPTSNKDRDLGERPGSAAFSFSPWEDSIPPNGQRNVDITYAPGSLNESQLTYLLQVAGGPTRRLILTGTVLESKCTLNSQRMDFGPMAVGSAVQKVLSIKCVGPNPTVYCITSLPPGVTVSATRARIAVNQTQDILVTLRPAQASPIHTQIVITARGMRAALKVAVKADPKIPKVDLKADETLDFGKVVVGTREFRPLKFVNVGSIPATLFLDLSVVPDFTLYDMNHKLVESTTEPEDDLQKTGGALMVCRNDDDDAEDDASEEYESDSDGGLPQVKAGRRYKIVVNEKKSLECFLAFCPTTATTQPLTFSLLVTLLGIPASETSQDLMNQVSAEALKPKLVISHNEVDFGSKVVVKEGTSKQSTPVTIRLTNEVSHDLNWTLVAPKDSLSSEVFRITPSAGKLAPGHTTSVQISFFPVEVRSYSMRVGVCLDASSSASKYMEIILMGSGAYPALTFDRSELILPVVPLDVPARGTFVINNEGYESLDLRWRLPGAAKWKEPGTLPISLAFPDGTVLGHTHSSIVVEVTCTAKKPTSFTATIDFADDEDGVFCIPVCFTADNCVLSVFPYLVTHKLLSEPIGNGYTLTAEDERKPIMLKHLEDPADTSSTPKGRSEGRSVAGSGYETDQTNTYKIADKTNRKSFTKKNVERLRGWLNANVFQDGIDDLLATLTSTRGRPLVEMIEHLSGRPPPGAIKSEKFQQMNKRDAVAAEAGMYDDILTHLKGWGASLADVRTEYLLKYEDFLRLNPQSKGWGSGVGVAAPTPHSKVCESTARARMGERRFHHRQLHAWMTVLFQVIKVFALPKITWKGLKALPQSPAIHARAADERWHAVSVDPSSAGSNLYSVAEGLLLKWFTVHQAHYFPSASEPRVTTFDELKSCKAFAAVLCSYIPTLETRLGLMSPGQGKNQGDAQGGGHPEVAANSSFIANPASLGDCEVNAGLVLEAAKSYGIDLKVTAKDLVESTARDMVLTSLNLFHSLPQFIPQATILFAGKLHENITKNIELSNPHPWPIDYLVLLDDDTGEFNIDRADNKLRLDSRSSASLPIWTSPRFSRKCSARLTFLGIGRLGPNTASTIVFNVETSVDMEHASKSFSITSPLYEVVTHEFEVENPFDDRANFNVRYQQQYHRPTNAKGVPIVYGEEAASGTYQEAFWTAQDSLSVKKKDKAKLSFQFAPFIRGRYSCRIVLVDEKVGEIVYAINATATAPPAAEKLQFQTEQTAPQTKEIVLPFKNAAAEKCLSAIHNERFKGFKSKMRPMAADKTDAAASAAGVRYKVEYSSPFYSGPKEISPKLDAPDAPEAPGLGSRKKGVQKNPLVVPVVFTPKIPGVYPATITLTSSSDVRIIEVEGKCRSPGVKADLEFGCAARQIIQQELPLTNSTAKDWSISASLSGEFFSGPREVVVKAGKTKIYTLTFAPSWICDAKGSLVLKNQETLEKYTYNLTGRADEPLAENTLNVQCMARDTEKLVISVPNITSDDVVYTVESDVPFARGPATLPVQKSEIGKYELVLKPILSGKTTGSITFITPNKQYLWYVLHIHASRPPPERDIEVATTVRQALLAEISVSNPSDQEASFAVRKKGDGLHGDSRLIVAPRGSASFNLIYSPLKATVPGHPLEGQVSFFNDDIGEYWYTVRMTALEAAPEEAPEARSELGKTVQIPLAIENPLQQPLVLHVALTNPQTFSVSPSNTLTIKPLDVARPVVTYMPSAIAQRQETLVTFSHPKHGKWEFVVRGIGTPPTQMETSTVHAIVSRSEQLPIVFRNPFPLPRRFLVTLKSASGDDAGGPFELMMKRKTQTIGPFSSLTIPVSYSPAVIAEHRAAVAIHAVGESVADDLKWEFPIVGIAEAVPSDNVFRFACKSRQELCQNLSLPLTQVDFAEDESFTHEIVFPKEHPHLRAIQGSIVVHADSDKAAPLLTTNPSGEEVAAGYKMNVTVTFTPLRSFSTAVDLLVSKKSGGLWRFEFQFEAASPAPDDVIILEAAVAQRSSVAFLLKNVFEEPLNYRCYFTVESAAEFSVSPAKGTLKPAVPVPKPTPSTQFVVSFTSSQYGKTLQGMLIIETDLMEWCYEVRGSLPRYHAPVVATSRVDTRLRADTQEAMKSLAASKTDFVRHNRMSPNRPLQRLLK